MNCNSFKNEIEELKAKNDEKDQRNEQLTAKVLQKDLEIRDLQSQVQYLEKTLSKKED